MSEEQPTSRPNKKAKTRISPPSLFIDVEIPPAPVNPCGPATPGPSTSSTSSSSASSSFGRGKSSLKSPLVLTTSTSSLATGFSPKSVSFSPSTSSPKTGDTPSGAVSPRQIGHVTSPPAVNRQDSVESGQRTPTGSKTSRIGNIFNFLSKPVRVAKRSFSTSEPDPTQPEVNVSQVQDQMSNLMTTCRGGKGARMMSQSQPSSRTYSDESASEIEDRLSCSGPCQFDCRSQNQYNSEYQQIYGVGPCNSRPRSFVDYRGSTRRVRLTSLPVHDSSPRSNSSSRNMPYQGQRSLDSSALDDMGGSKRSLLLFSKSALAAGVEMREAANLGNNELLFFHLLKVNQAFNILPNSSKLVVFDVALPVKKAFYALVYNSLRAATLVNNKQRFVGMLTITDFIQILHTYEAQGKDYVKELDTNTIADWKNAQAGENGAWKPFLFIYSDQSLYKAVKILLKNKVHRLPILDIRTNNILYILTLKRLLKYLNLYTQSILPKFAQQTPRELGIGSYENLITATYETGLRDALRLFMEHRVSSLPVVDKENVVQDIYCKFDVINLVTNNSYSDLNITVQDALKQRRRSKEHEELGLRSNFFEDTVVKCSPDDSLLVVIRTLISREVHRVIIADHASHKLVGVVSLSDVFKFFVVPPVPLPSNHTYSTSSLDDDDDAPMVQIRVMDPEELCQDVERD